MQILFNVITPLGKRVRTTEKYWQEITTIKHPQILGMLREVELTLIDPDTIRKSKSDENVFLNYRAITKYILCVVVKHFNGDGFVITAYVTGKEKEGTTIWQRKR